MLIMVAINLTSLLLGHSLFKVHIQISTIHTQKLT